MNYEKLIGGINLAIKNRFNIDSSSDSNEMLLALCPQELSARNVFRLERISEPKVKTRKTILVVGIEDDKQTVEALRWAATTKEMLVDPESSDLYLFICFNQSVPLEVCMRIESTEQFCRKYVIHPDETIEHFLERTFLAKPNSTSGELLSPDPLIKSFLAVQAEHDWFNTSEQAKWKEILLSGWTGSELIDELFNLKNDGNETPEENNN